MGGLQGAHPRALGCGGGRVQTFKASFPTGEIPHDSWSASRRGYSLDAVAPEDTIHLPGLRAPQPWAETPPHLPRLHIWFPFLNTRLPAINPQLHPGPAGGLPPRRWPGAVRGPAACRLIRLLVHSAMYAGCAIGDPDLFAALAGASTWRFGWQCGPGFNRLFHLLKFETMQRYDRSGTKLL